MIDGMTIDEVREEAGYLIRSRQEKRDERAARIRAMRGVLREAAVAEDVDPEWAREVTRRAVAGVPNADVAKPTPAGLRAEAAKARAWAREVRERTNWNALPCGQQDALGDRLDAAVAHAVVCEEAAGQLEGRGA